MPVKLSQKRQVTYGHQRKGGADEGRQPVYVGSIRRHEKSGSSGDCRCHREGETADYRREPQRSGSRGGKRNPRTCAQTSEIGEEKIGEVLAGIAELTGLADPLNKITLDRELDAGLRLCRQTCAIGVIGVIFEARPDAMVQVASLCIKSGNCAMLKGGSEAKRTNRKLFDVIYGAALSAGLPEGCLMLAETHDDIDNVLKCHESIDLLIPRGSNEFVQHIMNHTKIPVMGHADGVCHIYADRSADIEKAVPIILDAKTQYPAACNAAETLLVHRDIAGKLLPALARAFSQAHVCLRGTEEIREIIECESASEEDFRTEYLDYIISAKTVENIEEAVGHINRYGSHHTDCILTEDKEAAEYFMQLVDSAGVYCNCSTRFADGFRYGFGASAPERSMPGVRWDWRAL